MTQFFLFGVCVRVCVFDALGSAEERFLMGMHGTLSYDTCETSVFDRGVIPRVRPRSTISLNCAGATRVV